jgi:hypothetical protein
MDFFVHMVIILMDSVLPFDEVERTLDLNQEV